MASRLNPYLSFPGTAREAMEFYADVFGGELVLRTMGELGGPDAPEPENIMHGQLETPHGFTLMGADGMPGGEYQPGTAFAVSLSGDDEELRGFWEKLSDRGEVLVPLERQMWGDEFGSCRDRFGVTWMVNIGPAA